MGGSSAQLTCPIGRITTVSPISHMLSGSCAYHLRTIGTLNLYLAFHFFHFWITTIVLSALHVKATFPASSEDRCWRSRECCDVLIALLRWDDTRFLHYARCCPLCLRLQ